MDDQLTLQPPAERVRSGASTPDGPVPVRASLSPSRASDFMACPLRYRLRVVDRIPEPTDPLALRGTLVHSVLEELFDAESGRRTLEHAQALLPAAWARLRAEQPDLAEMFGEPTPPAGADTKLPQTGETQTDEIAGAFGSSPADRPPADRAADEIAWLTSCRDLLGTYFTLEDPRWVEPSAREARVEHRVDETLTLAGIVDRLDIAPDGRVRVVDYKTGRSPDERFEERALFQMRFYALLIWRTRGVVPTVLQLLYLGDGVRLEYAPTEADLRATERKLLALWSAIRAAFGRGEFPARSGPLCRFCSFRELCPAWGGAPPPMPGTEWVDPAAGAPDERAGSPIMDSSGDPGVRQG